MVYVLIGPFAIDKAPDDAMERKFLPPDSDLKVAPATDGPDTFTNFVAVRGLLKPRHNSRLGVVRKQLA